MSREQRPIFARFGQRAFSATDRRAPGDQMGDQSASVARAPASDATAAGDADRPNSTEEIRELRVQEETLAQLLREHVGRPSTVGVQSPSFRADRALTKAGEIAQRAHSPTTPLSEDSRSKLGLRSTEDAFISKQLRFVAKNLSLEVFGKASIVADRGTMTEKRPEKTPRDEMYMLHPLSTVRFVWDAISAILICFIAAMLPYRIAFIEGWALAWTLTDFLMDLFFMCDIILNFRTGYVDSDGKVVMKQRKAAMHYLRTWFFLDIMATIPLDWFMSGLSFEEPATEEKGDDGNAAQLFNMLRLFKLLKLLRLLRVAKLLQQLKRIEDQVVAALSLHSHSVFSLFKLLVMLLTFAHWNCCFQFFLANDGEEVHEDSWVMRAELDGLPPEDQWSWAYYHAMVQLLAIAEGVVPPKRLSEVWSFMVSILLGAALYAIFVASLTSVVGELGAASRKYRARIDMLGEYMRYSSMPDDLRKKLVAYYELCYPGRVVCDEDAIFEEVSHPLRSRMALFQSDQILDILTEVLKNEKLTRAVAAKLNRVVFVDGDFIIHEGEPGHGLYFVKTGGVEVLMPSKLLITNAEATKRRRETVQPGKLAGKLDGVKEDGGTGRRASNGWRKVSGAIDVTANMRALAGGPERKPSSDSTASSQAEVQAVVATLAEKAFFGEMSLLNADHVALADVRTKGHADCFYLTVDEYRTTLELFPDFKKYVEMIAKIRILSCMYEHGIDAGNKGKPRSRDDLIKRAEEMDVAELMSAYTGRMPASDIGADAVPDC